MATYYWVGGAGAWTSANRINWSLSSGGAGSAGIPTKTDDVVFDSNSGTGTITLGTGTSICNNFTVTASQALTFGGVLAGVYGNFSLPSGGSVVWSAYINFAANTPVTITTNGKSIGGTITFAGEGSWTLQDSLTTPGAVTVQSGTFNTNNYSFSALGLQSTGNFARAINLGSSTVTLAGSLTFSGSGLAFNAGSSSIVFTGSNSISGSGYTFYNVSFTYTASGATAGLNGSNTYNNVSIAANSSGTAKVVTISGDQTIGTLTTSGTTPVARIQFASSTAGTSQKTLTVGAFGTVTNTEWKYINLAGAVSTWSAPIGVFDMGGNTGITFDTSTLYWVGGAGAWDQGNKWAASSGGAVVSGATPGPQNNVVFDASSGAGSVSVVNIAYCNNMDASATPAKTFSIGIYVYGSLNIGGSGTYTGTVFNFTATSTGKTITTNGKTIQTVTFDGVGGEWTLQDALVATSSVTVTNGSFVSNNQTISTGTISSNNSNVRSISLGSSSVSVSSTITFTTPTNLTFNAGTSTITCSATSPTFQGGGQTFYNVVFTANSTGSTTIAGVNTFNNLTVSGHVTAGSTRTTSFSNNQTVNGTFTATGSSVSARALLVGLGGAGTPTAQSTITAAAVSLSNVDLCGIIGAGAATWSGTSVGDRSGNSGITFTSPKTVYWSLAAGGAWNTAVAWATSSGGSPSTANFPLAQDTIIIDDAGLSSGSTITATSSGANYYSIIGAIDASSRTLPMTLSLTAYVYGNMTLSSAVTTSGGATLFYNSTTINAASVSFGPNVVGGATLTTAGAMAWAQAGSVAGTLTLGGNLTVAGMTGVIATSTINFGSYKLIFTTASGSFSASGAYTTTGTPVFDFNFPAGAGTFTASFGSPTEANAIAVNLLGGTGTISISGAIKSLNPSGFTGTLTGSNLVCYGSFSTSGITTYSVSSVTFSATTAGNTINAPSANLGGMSFNGNGGSYKLLSDQNMANGTLSVTNGSTFDTNGYTFACGNLTVGNSSGTQPGTLILGASNVTATGNVNVYSNSTFNAGTSSVVVGYSLVSAVSGGISLYNLEMYPLATTFNTMEIRGVTSTNDLTLRPGFIYRIESITVNGQFKTLGTATSRVLIMPNLYQSTPSTITAASASLAYTDITRIVGAGAATWSGTGLADGGGNSGITFDVVPRTLYWVGGAGTWSRTGTTNWSLSSGGAGGENPPVICDTAIFDSNSGTGAVSIDTNVKAPNVNLSTYGGTIGQLPAVFGNFTGKSSLAIASPSFYGYNSTITSNGIQYTGNIGILATSGTVSLADDLYGSGISITSGTFNSNNKIISTSSTFGIGAGVPYPCTVNLGTSTIYEVGNFAFGVGVTFNGGSSNIVFVPSAAGSSTLTASGQTFGTITYAGSIGSSLTISGSSNTINKITNTDSLPFTLKFLGASSNTIGTWDVKGQLDEPVFVTSTTTSQFTLVSSSSVQSANYLNLSYSIGSPSSTWYAGSGSTDGGNNTGWSFSDAPVVTNNGGLFFGSNF